MSDIVEMNDAQLLAYLAEVSQRPDCSYGAAIDMASTAIARQAATIERLRAALEPFAKVADRYDPDEGDDLQVAWDWSPTIGMLRRARAARTGAT